MSENSKKEKFGGGRGGSGFVLFFWGGEGQGGCEWRSEAFVKIQKKNLFLGVGLGGGGGTGWIETEN